jgi:hypothetical protein
MNSTAYDRAPDRTPDLVSERMGGIVPCATLTRTDPMRHTLRIV